MPQNFQDGSPLHNLYETLEHMYLSTQILCAQNSVCVFIMKYLVGVLQLVLFWECFWKLGGFVHLWKNVFIQEKSKL